MAKTQKIISSVNEILAELTQHILTYESDTFSAKQSKITKREAMCLASDFVVFCMNEAINNQSVHSYLDGITISRKLNILRNGEDE